MHNAEIKQVVEYGVIKQTYINPVTNAVKELDAVLESPDEYFIVISRQETDRWISCMRTMYHYKLMKKKDWGDE